jgi:hypothetical protein
MMKERIRLPLFDTTVLSAGAITAGTKYYLFQNGLGSALGAGFKNKCDTNMSTNGQMPYDRLQLVGLKAYLFSRNATPQSVADINFVAHNSLITFKREDRAIFELPLSVIPSGMGLYVGGHATYATLGMPQISNLFKILPEEYTRSQRIQVEIEATNAITVVADTYIQIYLEGIVDKSF